MTEKEVLEIIEEAANDGQTCYFMFSGEVGRLNAIA